MKTRNSYVSNSSSSSFIVIGEELPKNDFDNALEISKDAKKTILAVFEEAGICADIIVRLCPETAEAIRNVFRHYNARFFDVSRTFEDCYEIKIEEEDQGRRIFFFDNDNDSPGLASVERTLDFLESYRN